MLNYIQGEAFMGRTIGSAIFLVGLAISRIAFGQESYGAVLERNLSNTTTTASKSDADRAQYHARCAKANRATIGSGVAEGKNNAIQFEASKSFTPCSCAVATPGRLTRPGTVALHRLDANESLRFA
jgi:hypothetical protein